MGSRILEIKTYREWSSAAATETEDQVESRLLLDVVILKGSTILKLLSSEDESLLIGRDALLILDLSLHIFYGVRGLDI